MKEGTKREQFSYLEALSRLLVSIVPWLEKKCENDEEEKHRTQYCVLARTAIDSGTDPDSLDYMNLSNDFQPITHFLWERTRPKI
ncbi:hypothetical protein CR203_19770 [Salipaludibacillus neizhouensis]|uniref:DUF2264 domain-containing protein n=1 Tax=Salipaludibacillus neizhouensis TaxID=885475 RepID=A0A3A9JXE9_9BACI|nr:DUF2264 domain-containing protein [Salipaludibacillus neizhouensis]RKL65564.1 hypothetical protein CR203_19770 [Salipaludibacillus neizhouensis]